MAYLERVKSVKAVEGRNIEGRVENVAGVVDWALLVHLRGRGKAIKVFKQEDDRVRSPFYKELGKHC